MPGLAHRGGGRSAGDPFAVSGRHTSGSVLQVPNRGTHIYVYFPHRTYKNGMRPDNGLDRAAVEKVQVKLFSMQKAGMALEHMSRIVVRDARRLVAMLPPGQYQWTDGKLQLSTASLHTIMQSGRQAVGRRSVPSAIELTDMTWGGCMGGDR
jgi:hypothetical protein